MHIKMLALASSDLLIVVVNAGSVGNWLRFKVSMGKYSNILDRAISDLCEGDGESWKGTGSAYYIEICSNAFICDLLMVIANTESTGN